MLYIQLFIYVCILIYFQNKRDPVMKLQNSETLTVWFSYLQSIKLSLNWFSICLYLFKSQILWKGMTNVSWSAYYVWPHPDVSSLVWFVRAVNLTNDSTSQIGIRGELPRKGGHTRCDFASRLYIPTHLLKTSHRTATSWGEGEAVGPSSRPYCFAYFYHA